MKRCKNCKFWVDPDVYHKKCDVRLSKESKLTETKYCLRDEDWGWPPAPMFFVEVEELSSDDVHAFINLRTAPEFGCVEWKEKE